MKKTLAILILIFVLPTIGSSVWAADGTVDDLDNREIVTSDFGSSNIDDTAEVLIIDEYTRETSNKYFDLTLERGDQTPFGKYIPYVLTVTPHIDSTRTQILWNIPLTMELKTKHPQFVSMNRGETYVFEARVRPLQEGIYDFSVSVIAWQHDTNYTNAINDTVMFDSKLVLQPVSDHYKMLNILVFVGIGLAFVLTFVLGFISINKIIPKAKKWLTPPKF